MLCDIKEREGKGGLVEETLKMSRISAGRQRECRMDYAESVRTAWSGFGFRKGYAGRGRC